MFFRIWSSAVIGVEAFPIEIETNIYRGKPKWHVVGLPDNAVKESQQRVWSALKNSRFRTPRGVITVNLAPADIRKEGSAYDLPIALGVLLADDQSPNPFFDPEDMQAILDEIVIVGELSLDGRVRPVRGILPIAVQARKAGRRALVIPHENAAEAAVVEGLEVYPVETLSEAFELVVKDAGRGTPFKADLDAVFEDASRHVLDFSDVRGQVGVKRALEVAAAGGHNVLMVGPPGAGKTMLARRLPTILPQLSLEEALETTQVHSVSGRLNGAAKKGLVATRPFRSPHHTISNAGLVGGGSNPMPGEISLAHHGVLFLDELPEFDRAVLEVMRQPLEEGAVTIARAIGSVRYPARFMLVASMNPCPCGHAGDPNKECVCSPGQIQRYLGKISGPLLDRIDLHVEVTPVPFEDLQSERKEEPSSAVRTRIEGARGTQAGRFEKRNGKTYCNAQMSAPEVRRHATLDEAGRRLLKTAIERLGLSARAHDRILKVARTIADLAGSETVCSEHLAEAIQYRSLDREQLTGIT